ncbi:hypothetical protein V9690_24500, partial [Klebsiella pneumoniae]
MSCCALFLPDQTNPWGSAPSTDSAAQAADADR